MHMLKLHRQFLTMSGHIEPLSQYMGYDLSNLWAVSGANPRISQKGGGGLYTIVVTFNANGVERE